MLFCTSLVALVGAADTQPNNSPRKLQIVNTKVSSSVHNGQIADAQRQSTICELIFPTSVLAVKMNRKRLIVVLESEIYIYDISTMKLLHTIETGPNPNGAYRHLSAIIAVPKLEILFSHISESLPSLTGSRLRALSGLGPVLPRLPLPIPHLHFHAAVPLICPGSPARSDNRRRPPLRHHLPLRTKRYPSS